MPNDIALSDSCLFCKIIRNQLPTNRIYEDEKTLVFLDKFPLVRGHTLVIPKSHVANLGDLDDKYFAALFATLHKVLRAVQKGVGTASTTIGLNNGPASGQEIPHVHLHIMPRFEGDGGGGVHSIMKTRPKLSEEDMEIVRDEIRGNLSR